MHVPRKTCFSMYPLPMTFEKVWSVFCVLVPVQNVVPPPSSLSSGQHTRHVPSLQYLPPTSVHFWLPINAISLHPPHAFPHIKNAHTVKILIFINIPFCFLQIKNRQRNGGRGVKKIMCKNDPCGLCETYGCAIL